jgi:hypothetical protein
MALDTGVVTFPLDKPPYTAMSPVQCRAGRAWLDWSQATLLAAKATVSSSLIRDFESRRRVPHINNRLAIHNALEDAGLIISDDGNAIRWVRNSPSLPQLNLAGLVPGRHGRRRRLNQRQ